jgi:hypothetical protein
MSFDAHRAHDPRPAPAYTPPDFARYRIRFLPRRGATPPRTVLLRVCEAKSHRETGAPGAARGRCLSCGLAVRGDFDPQPKHWMPIVESISLIEWEAFIAETCGRAHGEVVRRYAVEVAR